MKKILLLSAMIAVTAASCTRQQEILLQVSNPMDRTREDAIVLLTRGEISKWSEIQAGKLPVLQDLRGSYIPCQADDVDGDGEWDELFGLISLGPSAQKKVAVTFVDSAAYPVFPTRTNIRLGSNEAGYPELPAADRLEGVSYHNFDGRTSAVFQMEGVAWENDVVGFRNYMDQRNGIDIFGKTTSRMVLDSVGIAGSPSYHEPAGWGMDVLKVGSSLGAGAIGFMYRDSIYRVGDNGHGSYHLLFEGSQRSRFNLTYSNWKIEQFPLEVVHQIGIIGGRHYYQGLVSHTGGPDNLALVAGIVNMKSDSLHVLELNENYTALVTHAPQAEDGSILAMALMVPSAYLKTTGQTRDQGEGIIQTYYAVLDAEPGKPLPYRFYALWEQEDPRWASLEEVTAFLRQEAGRWTQSVIYQVSP